MMNVIAKWDSVNRTLPRNQPSPDLGPQAAGNQAHDVAQSMTCARMQGARAGNRALYPSKVRATAR
jgi:hypothetical protein